MATARWMIASAVGGLVILGTVVPARAQTPVPVQHAQPIASLASFPPGSIHGSVLDENGQPVAGAMVSAIGGTTVIALTDKTGHFELHGLQPGPYLVRAHLAGFVTAPAQVVQVRPSGRADSAIALRHAGTAAAPVLAAGFGGGDAQPAAQPAPSDAGSGADTEKTDDGETAWRLRHARRSILKDLTLPSEVMAADFMPAKGPLDAFARSPFSGQLDFLTSSSFDQTQQLLTPGNLPAGIANLSVTAPFADGDWTVRGAYTQADMAAWIVSGAYQTRGPARHQYNAGFSYSTQRYDIGSPLALDTTINSRSAGEAFAFDTFTVSPVVTLTYGSRYARYDYLEGRGLASPRVALTLTPVRELRVRATAGQSGIAPGAEEFLPPVDTGIWLPPQRLFSPLDPDTALRAEHTTHASVDVERDFGPATVSLAAFHQHTENQIVTLFGADVPDQPMSPLGHYFVGNAGNAVVSGCAAKVRAAITSWLTGSVEYSLMDAQLSPTTDTRYLMLTAPSAVGPRMERIYNVSTRLETKLPETATRVLVLYRVGNGYAHPPEGPAADDRPSVDSRFEVQLRQSLPFMNFTSARWEMLVGVRNFFRDAGPDVQSAYDELLVVRPPKRIVGGLTMQF